LIPEERLDGFLSVIEDSQHVISDKEAIDEAAAEDRISDLVAHAGLVPFGRESMAVDPETVGAAFLFIDEVVGRVPPGDFRLPTKGDAMDAEAVVDESAGLHDDGCRRKDGEVEPGRRDGLEVFRTGEEVEGFLESAWKESILFE
jgi:hypothetical protein